MASKGQRGHDALCKLLLEEALMRLAAEEGVQVDRVEWRDLAPDQTSRTSLEREPAKEMKVWSGNRCHFLNLTNDEFQGCLSDGSVEYQVEGKMLGFLKEHHLRVGDT